LRGLAFAASTALLLAASARATVATDALVDAIGQMESGGGRRTVGDRGRANGMWQMHINAWKDVTAYRARKGLPTWNYNLAHDPAVARLYARDYLAMLEDQLRQALRRAPTAEMVYAAYNVGFARLERLGFRLEKTPAMTRDACSRLAPLMAELQRTSDAKRAFAKAK
jgi:hypothetical protein